MRPEDHGVAVRSAYRSPAVNGYCHERFKEGDHAYFCNDNDYNRAQHIWDHRDANGCLGATASIVIPWYLPRFEKTRDPRPLAWWIRDNIPDYDLMSFYPWLCAFNIRWYEGDSSHTIRLSDGKNAETLTEKGMENFDGDHSELYPGFPALRLT